MSPFFKLTFAVSFILLVGIGSQKASAFLWFGNEEAPQKSQASSLLAGCFGHLTNLYPLDEANNPVPRGNLRKISPTCGDGFTTVPKKDLYVLTRVENGSSLIYIMDDKDGKLRVRKFPIATTAGRDEIIEITDKDYEIGCQMKSGPPEVVYRSLSLDLNYNNKNSANLFRVGHHTGAVPMNRQRVSGKDDMGPHITQAILEEAAKDARTLGILPRGPAYNETTQRNIKNGCTTLANNLGAFPSGQESDGSRARIEAVRNQVLTVYSSAPVAPSYDTPKGSSGGPAGTAVSP